MPRFSRSEALLLKTSQLRDIPTLSVVVGSVLKMLRSETVSRGQVAELLKRDQVLTARVLRMVNSGFYGRAAEITDVKRALHFLGDHTVMALVMGTSVFNNEDYEAAHWFDVQDFWLHCLATALAAEFLAIRLSHPNPEESFTCGLLHDLGKIALFRADRETLEEVVNLVRSKGLSFIEAEQELGLPGHHVLGERMATQWSLPLVVRKCIRYHHRDVTQFESIFEEHRKMVMVVSLADAMAKRCALGYSGDDKLPEYSQVYLDYLKIKPVFMEELEARLPLETLKAKELLIERTLQKRSA
jgi:putative nucleotidyltransferase with HDIG domain